MQKETARRLARGAQAGADLRRERSHHARCHRAGAAPRDDETMRDARRGGPTPEARRHDEGEFDGNPK